MPAAAAKAPAAAMSASTPTAPAVTATPASATTMETARRGAAAETPRGRAAAKTACRGAAVKIVVKDPAATRNSEPAIATPAARGVVLKPGSISWRIERMILIPKWNRTRTVIRP